jgi:hypothetical protein
VPANETIYGAIGLAYDVTRFEQDVLNPSGVNVLRRLPDSSIRIWGARTLASEPLFQNLKTRLILNVVDRSIEHGTSWAIFQQGSVLGEQLCLALYDFAEHLWRAGALVGETETEAFYISPTGRIGNEQRAIEVGLAIHRANEFVRVRVVYASDDVVPEISSEPVDQDVMTSAVNKRELAKASVPGHPKVFISYSRTDWDEFVAPLIALLAKNQPLLRGGQDWMDKIDEALQSCSVMVLCLSPEAVSSKHVKYEYRYFFRNNKDILPLVCRPVRVPAELGGLQHLRYEQQEALIARLTELLGEHLRSE